MAKKQASEKKLNTEENGTEKTAEKNVKVEKTVEKNVKEGKTAEKNVKEGKTAEKNVKEGKTVEKNVKEGKTVEKNAQATEEGPNLLTRGENRSVAVPFALTALAMLIVPVAVFFVVESALPDLGITDKNKILSYSGICAVISANIIMALYALHAYREEKRDWAAVQEKKRETKKKD